MDHSGSKGGGDKEARCLFLGLANSIFTFWPPSRPILG